ncbi:MAG: immunoglobulin domain-containing protein [Verrucomicrobia bacterium]|nr:immunoglobulin domain-containing protein [Verrucomicrobiota bacterium]
MKLFASPFLRSLIAGVAWLAFGVSAASAQTALPNAQVGQSYSYQVTTNPAAAAGTVYAATGLPSGVSINTSSGLISGTPTTAGTATGTISLTASGATNSFSYSLLVNPATGTPVIASATTATATVGQAFTYSVTASNTPTSFNIGTLPAGLSVGGTTTAPTITGTPTAAGTSTVSLSANNATGTGTAVTLTLTVNPAGPVPVITSATTATGTPNVAFTYTIVATNTPLSFAATGLPLGLSLNSTTGVISGTPTVARVYQVTLTATNNNGTSASVNLTLTVGAVSSITSATTASGGVGVAFSYTIQASNSPSTYNVTGLPAGLSVNTSTGVISGTPTAVGTSSVSLSANNSLGAGPVTTLTLTIGNPPIITSATTAGAVASSAFTYSITATNTPTSYAAGNLPVGLSVNTTTGVISGTANIAGTFNLTISAANASGSGPTVTLVLTVTAPTGGGGGITTPFPVAITGQPSSQTVAVGASATFSVTATGTAPTYQWKKDGTDIAGATSSSLDLASVTTASAGSYTVVVSNQLGPVTSNAAVLTVSTLVALPSITAQPQSQSALIGANVTLSVTAGGTGLTYQWRKDGAPIAGATGASLTLSGVGLSSAGSYTVVVTNTTGSTTSAAAVLGVTGAPITGSYFGSFGSNGGTFALYVRSDRTGVFLGYARASKIALVSRDVVVSAGGAFSVSVTVTTPSATTSDGPAIAAADATYIISGSIDSTSGAVSGSVSGLGLSFTAPAAASGSTSSLAGFYQAGAAGSSAASYAIVGAAGNVLVITTTGTTADAGTGTVSAAGAVSVTQTENAGRISGSIQTATVSLTATTSTGSTVTFLGANNDARVENEKLLNISTRSQTGTGGDALIAGFVITGTQPKSVLVRAIGPTLSQFGLNGALVAAKLDLYRGSTLVRSGADWSAEANAAAIAATAARVGAFALPATSRDASMLITLDPGNYTAIVTGQNSATGVSLVEVYDATVGSIPNNQRVVNISSRSSVGTLDSTLIGGFYISGAVPKRVLIRGVGPSLAQFGLTGTLARAQLTLFKGTQVVTSNAGWSTSADAAAIASTASQVGAFALTPGSVDAALLLSLEPGAYTAQVSGVNGATGVALVEIYEVP